MKKALWIFLSIVILVIVAIIVFPYVDPYSRHNLMKYAKENHPLQKEYLEKMKQYKFDLAIHEAHTSNVNEIFNKVMRDCRFNLISIEHKFNLNPIAFWKHIEKTNHIIVMSGIIKEILYDEVNGAVFSNDKVIINFYFENDDDLLDLKVGDTVELIGQIKSSQEVEASKIHSIVETKENDSTDVNKIESTTTIGRDYLFFEVISTAIYDRDKAFREAFPAFEDFKKANRPVEPIKPDIKIDGSWKSLSNVK